MTLLPLFVGGCANTQPSYSSDSLSDFSSESSSTEDSSSEQEPEFIEDNAPYYVDSYSLKQDTYVKKQEATFPYAYWSNTPLVIYMTFDTALNYLFANNVTTDVENSHITYNCPDDLSFVVDSENNTILVHNYDEINLFSKKYDTKFGVIDEETTTKYVMDNNSSYFGGEDITFNLNDYSMDIYQYNDKFYVPFAVVNTLTFNYALWSSVNFNGEGFYLLNLLTNAFSLYGGGGTPYMTDFYNGPYRRSKGREQTYFVEHNYNAFMFQLDTFYGFRDEKMAPFNNYLSTNYPGVVTQLKSSSEQDYCRGVEKIMEEIIGDGHTNTGNASSAFGTGSFSTAGYSSSRSRQLNQDSYDCYVRRRNALGNNAFGLRTSGNTAIITFDGFYHAGVNFTTANARTYINSDGFSLFYDSFKKIAANSSIKNVIFDITVNGGGDTNALIPMLGFLSKHVDLTMYSPLTKLTANLSYKVDTNLDGKYDDNDSYEGKYNFYVLTSNYSFSCANLFPQICKEMGIAKIIGEQSGGGACVVYYSATPDGKTYRISSNMRDGDPTNPVRHNDLGIPVDYSLSRDYFYDDAYLDEFVNGLA